MDAPPCFLLRILGYSFFVLRETINVRHEGKKRRISRESFSTLVKETVFSLSLFHYPATTLSCNHHQRNSFSPFHIGHGIATFLVLHDTLILFVSDRIREQDRKFLNERVTSNNHATEQPRNLTSWESGSFSLESDEDFG